MAKRTHCDTPPTTSRSRLSVALVPPKVPAAAVAPVLQHAEAIRAAHAPAAAGGAGPPAIANAWRGPARGSVDAKCCMQAAALADGSDAV
jgi:hypothetical protein